jgi:hypothetical protein
LSHAVGPVAWVVFVPDCRTVSVRKRTWPENLALPDVVLRALTTESSALRTEITRVPLPFVVTVQPLTTCVVVYDQRFVTVPVSEARNLAPPVPSAAAA